MLTGRAEDGRVVTDASLVITRGERHWFVTSEELVHYDDQSGKAQPRLEQALTEGIANVLGDNKAKACFAIGHRELSIDDVGPEGLAEVRHRLEKSNFEVSAVDLARPGHQSERMHSARGRPGPSVEVDRRPRRRASWLSSRRRQRVPAQCRPMLGEDKRVQRSGLEASRAADRRRLRPRLHLGDGRGVAFTARRGRGVLRHAASSTRSRAAWSAKA